MLNAILTALKIPSALAAICDFLRWLAGQFKNAEAEKQHAENQAAIDAAFADRAPGMHDAPAQSRPAPDGTPAIPSGENSGPRVG